jgi:sodium transport system ATP-binding protein
VTVVSHGRTVAEGTVDALNARCGQTDFEETFVALAFTPQESQHA